MSRQLLIFLLLIFTLPLKSLAQEKRELSEYEKMAKESYEKDWQDGIHIIAGLGLNAAQYVWGSETASAGVGTNLRTDITYFLKNGTALELSGSVMFNNLDRTTLWSTTFSTGVRFGIPYELKVFKDNLAPYARLMIGRTTNVAIFDGKPSKQFRIFDEYDANRVQSEGSMLGAGIGAFEKSKSGRIWYTELTFEYHRMEKFEVIEDDNGVQVVVDERIFKRHPELYALCLTFGLMVF